MTAPFLRTAGIPVILIALNIPFSFCGHRLPPPGGPEDKAPPVLLEMVPGMEQTGVDLSTGIQLVFDENVDKESAEKAILVSPVHEEVELKVKGKRVELRPVEGLFPSTTYQVTVGSGLMDERRNHFSGPFTFYFSTGDSLDTGTIHGEVRQGGKPAKSAYIIAITIPDSIGYQVQADSSGKYRLAKLPKTRFHLRAFLDQNGDGAYRFAVEPTDEREAEIFDEPVLVDFDLVVVDTSPPVLQSVEPQDSMTLRLVFDDPMKLEAGRLSLDDFRLFPETDSTGIILFDSAEVDSTDGEAILLRTHSPLDDGVDYWIELSNVTNESHLVGRPGDNRKKFRFSVK